jgi:glycosyltransferase involved in cell wall biosynthesis
VIRYSRGFAKKAKAIRATAEWRWKLLKGRLGSYPVYRPPVDHSVYEVDNRLLGSTDQRSATLTHQVSWVREVPGRCLVEFEHPFALVGHVDERTDYVRFRDELRARVERFCRWFDPCRHRLLATSAGAAARARSLFLEHSCPVPEQAIEVLHWGAQAVPHCPDRTRRALRVFHYGGAYPWAKGTGDLLAVARLLPHVHFFVSADPGHALFCGQSLPANVELTPFTSKRDYVRMMGQSDVVMCPTYSDGWGVFIDALARGMPVIAYGSYDKAEAVIDGRTGFVVPLPAKLSLYDGFMAGQFRNWAEYNAFVASSESSELRSALGEAVNRYETDRALLLAHAEAAAELFRQRHDGLARVKRIREIYRAMLNDDMPSVGPRR